ncbi:MAG: MoxR family ATPase [Saprospiraceae bacterium]|nr:MoxR family ATPase [Lewinella sp.]
MISIRNNPLPDFKAENYLLLDPGLQKAVEVAIALNQPLLLTGEPGTGKTRLAHKIAYELATYHKAHQFLPSPLVFNTKTTSSARDLFYTYDALGHFQDANIKRSVGEESKTMADFIELQAFGKAIALSQPGQLKDIPVQLRLEGHEESGADLPAYSSVVLIDEIDKAPRDFPNDILHEVEYRQFQIKEMGNAGIKYHPEQRIVVIMTSNSEKNLPDAFLRRCIFYHIPFPTHEQLKQIIDAQLELRPNENGKKLMDELIDLFMQVRKQSVRKKPATAELIAWMRLLAVDGVFEAEKQQKGLDYLADYLSIIVKTKEDRDEISKMLKV